MKGLILFKSRYGSTAQYAYWLSQSTGFPLVNMEYVRESDVEAADLVIVGSLIRIGRYQAAGWLKKHWDMLQDKRVFLFSVSGENDPARLREWMSDSLPPKIWKAVTYFPLRGRIRLEDLNFWDRLMVKLGSKLEKDPNARRRMKEGFDFMDRHSIKPIADAAILAEAELTAAEEYEFSGY